MKRREVWGISHTTAVHPGTSPAELKESADRKPEGPDFIRTEFSCPRQGGQTGPLALLYDSMIAISPLSSVVRSALVALLLLAIAAALPVRADTTPIRVTAHNVNLRAAPNPTGDLVGQANYGDHFVARELGEEWVEIEPPDGIEAWVKAEYVLRPQNTIGANRVNVRAGSSINYNIIDTLSLGTSVEPVQEFGEWLKIKPPSTARVWISRQFVDPVVPEAEAAAVETVVAAAEPPPLFPSNSATSFLLRSNWLRGNVRRVLRYLFLFGIIG